MCKCNPAIKTPYCGRGNCVWPEHKKKELVMSRFGYVKYDDESCRKQALLKNKCEELEVLIEKEIPFSKESIAAKTKAINNLEIAYMWIGKAIRDEQIARNKDTEPQEEIEGT